MLKYRGVAAMAILLFLIAAVSGAQPLVLDGQVVDSQDQPVVGAEVHLRPLRSPYERGADLLKGEPWGESIDHGVTDAAGRYRLEAADWGLYRVIVEAPEHVPAEYRLRPLIDDTTLPKLTLKVDEGAAIEVRDALGTAAEGAMVILSDVGRGSSNRSDVAHGWRPTDRVRAIAADGAAIVPYLSGENLAVTVLYADHRPWTGRLTPDDVALEVDLKAVAAWRIVRVMRDGKPLPEVLLTHGLVPVALTAEEGRATLFGEGSMSLSVLTEDGRRQTREWTAEDDVIELPASGWISGTVVGGESGQGLAGALVWDDTRFNAVRSDAEGRFRWPFDDEMLSDLSHLGAAYPGYVSVTAETQQDGLERSADRLRFTLQPNLQVTGRVVDAEGQAVADAVVELRRWHGRTASTKLLQEIVTDRQGTFRLGDLVPGAQYEVRASAPGKAPSREVVTPRGPSESQDDVIELVLQSSAVLTGRVLDDTSQPLEGVRVDLFGVADVEGRLFEPTYPERRSAPSAISGADGRFEISEVVPGHHSLALRAEGFAPRVLPSISVAAEMGVEKGRQDLGDLALRKGTSLALRVVNSAGQAVPEAEVGVRGAMDGMARQGLPRSLRRLLQRRGKTDGEGRFEFDDLQPDRDLLLWIRHPEYVNQEHHVRASEEMLEITLSAGAFLRGRVLDSQGKGLGNAQLQVKIEPLVEGQQFSGGHSVLSAGSSGADGTFEIAGVTSGRVTVSARFDGYQEGETTTEVSDGDVVEGLTVQLLAALELQGIVLDEQGAPAPNARISVMHETSENQRSTQSTAAGSDGRFRLPGLVSGDATVEARDDQGRRVSRPIVLEAGMVPVTLILEAGQVLSGRVVDSGGEGVADAEIRLRGATKMLSKGSREDGRFVLRLEGGGRYSLGATRADLGRATMDLDVPEGGSLESIELVLPVGGKIVGHIDGLSAEDLLRVGLRATLKAKPFFGAFSRMTREGRVDLEGSLVIEGIFPGTWSVRADVRGSARSAEQTVEVHSPGETVVVDLSLGEAGVTLSGQILHNGAPAAHAMVSPGHVRVDSAGRFRIEGLEPGPYRLYIYGPWGDHVHEGEIYADDEIQISIESLQLVGQVVDGNGEPLGGVQVQYLQPEKPRSLLSVTTKSDGRFEISGLQRGTYRLIAQKSGYGADSLDLEVTGSISDVNIILRSTESVTLSVQGPDGRPADRVAAIVLDATGQPSGIQQLSGDAEGRFQLDFIPTGTWEVLLMAEGSAPSRLAVQVPGGPYAVRLGPATQLLVQVPELAQDDTAAQLEIIDADGQSFSPRLMGLAQDRWPLRRGHFQFPILPPGTWQLTVTAVDGRQWQGTAVTSAAGPVEVVLE